MKYELIDNNNLILATRVHLEIFPHECAYSCFKKSIEDNHNNYKYYLVYKDTVIIGVTGLYIDYKYDDTIWLGWYGVLEEYRLHGFGKQIFLDTLEMAKEWGKERNIDTFRLYTSFDDNKIAQIIYKNYMDISEKYNNQDDINYNNTCLIYSKSLVSDKDVLLWNNQNINLKDGEKMIDDGLKQFIELTEGDIHIKISTTGEVF